MRDGLGDGGDLFSYTYVWWCDSQAQHGDYDTRVPFSSSKYIHMLLVMESKTTWSLYFMPGV